MNKIWGFYCLRFSLPPLNGLGHREEPIVCRGHQSDARIAPSWGAAILINGLGVHPRETLSFGRRARCGDALDGAGPNAELHCRFADALAARQRHADCGFGL
jgi:hypothetical protein